MKNNPPIGALKRLLWEAWASSHPEILRDLGLSPRFKGVRL